MKDQPCYCVLSMRQLLEALAEAQKPTSDGNTSVELSNCVVLEGTIVTDTGKKFQFAHRKTRRV